MDAEKIAAGLSEAVKRQLGRGCGMCFGTGKVKAYRGDRSKIACIHCDGTGLRGK